MRMWRGRMQRLIKSEENQEIQEILTFFKYQKFNFLYDWNFVKISSHLTPTETTKSTKLPKKIIFKRMNSKIRRS